MRNSPIGNLRNNRPDYKSSAYESNLRNQSPKTNPNHNSPSRSSQLFNTNEGSDYWRIKSRQLECELSAINQELIYQIRKNEKNQDLEDKIELLLAQNTHFVQQNESLIRLVQQKNSQIENWKKRFDNQSTHSNIAQTQKKRIFDHLNLKDQQHQIQIEKLLTEISRLQNEAVENENLRKFELHRIKNQYQSQTINQIQILRRSQHGNNEIQELNIQKLKDQIDQKNFEIQNLNRQIKLKNQELKAETSYNKNQLKKLEEQKLHEIDLIKTEHENTKKNLIQTHRRNEDDLKNLHENKVKRLSYQIEQKRHEIEEVNGKLKRIGKQNQSQLTRLTNENQNIRHQIGENDIRHQQRVIDLTKFYQNQFEKERQVNLSREQNQKAYYSHEIDILHKVIQQKEQEIKRLLTINKNLKVNELTRLDLISLNNEELKQKINQIIQHYERQIQLMKIKISQLYQTDLESLKSKMRNSYSNYSQETENLRKLLQETRERLAEEVQSKLDLRADYEVRLTQIQVSHERIQRQLKNMVAHRQKQIQGHTSKASLTHIEHNQLLQKGNQTLKEVLSEKRTLENHLRNKNKQIQALNLKIQNMLSLHKRDIEKLEADLNHFKQQHDKWLTRQQKETQEWNSLKKDLEKNNEELNQKLALIKSKSKENEQRLTQKINQKGLEIANLKGTILQLQSKLTHLNSINKVEVENVQKTVLETRSLMNSQKEKLSETANKQKKLVQNEADRIRSELQKQINDLKKQNEILEDNYRKGKIREEELINDVRGLTESVAKKAKLEQSVINIGLSNNYFKNVAEIFKKSIDA